MNAAEESFRALCVNVADLCLILNEKDALPYTINMAQWRDCLHVSVTAIIYLRYLPFKPRMGIQEYTVWMRLDSFIALSPTKCGTDLVNGGKFVECLEYIHNVFFGELEKTMGSLTEVLMTFKESCK